MWYYSTNGEKHGPMDEPAFAQLISTGVITPDTLVWKDGLANWTPLRQANSPIPTTTSVANTASATCSMCGKIVGEDNLIELMGVRVCAACKPKVVQSMREGVTPVGTNTAWSDGKKVMTLNLAALPPRCYKCNQPATGAPLKRKVMWHPPAFYLLLFLNLLIYAVVAAFARKQATVDIFLCQHHAQSRKYFIWGGWGGVALGFVFLLTGLFGNMGALAAIGGLFIVTSTLVGMIGASLARAARIKDDSVWLTGAGKPFLASLPPRP